MQYSSYTLQTLKPIPQNSSLQANSTVNPFEGILVILLLISLTLGGFVWKRHRAYRTATLQRQVEILERLWKIKPEE
jgi:hypothetical protein